MAYQLLSLIVGERIQCSIPGHIVHSVIFWLTPHLTQAALDCSLPVPAPWWPGAGSWVSREQSAELGGGISVGGGELEEVMEILKVISGLWTRDSGSSERLGFVARLSLRRKSRKTSLVSQGSASGVRGREGGLLIQERGLLIQEGGLLIQEGGETGQREVKGGTAQSRRQDSLTRGGNCWEGRQCVLNYST